MSVCALAVPAIGIVMVVTAREHQLYILERILKVVMVILNPTIVLAASVLVLTPSVLVGNKWPLRPRIAFGALGLASLFFSRFVFYWHVWGSQY